MAGEELILLSILLSELTILSLTSLTLPSAGLDPYNSKENL